MLRILRLEHRESNACNVDRTLRRTTFDYLHTEGTKTFVKLDNRTRFQSCTLTRFELRPRELLENKSLLESSDLTDKENIVARKLQ